MADAGVPPIDVSGLLELKRLQSPDKADGVARVVHAFLDESVQRLASLDRAVAADDSEQVQRAAHALKGIAGTVGANEMHDLAARLEQIGREGRAQDAPQLVKELQSAFGRARPVFERVLSRPPSS